MYFRGTYRVRLMHLPKANWGDTAAYHFMMTDNVVRILGKSFNNKEVEEAGLGWKIERHAGLQVCRAILSSAVLFRCTFNWNLCHTS